MYARAVEEAGLRLRNLRREEWEDFTLAAVAMALALVAAEALHELAVPLLLGGLAGVGLGVRALWRRWDLVERLSEETDAHAISEVFDYAARDATLSRRRGYALMIRRTIRERSPYDPRIASVADDFEALAGGLEDTSLVIEPACAVKCRRLLTEPTESVLFDPAAPTEDLLASIRRIRVGLTPAK